GRNHQRGLADPRRQLGALLPVAVDIAVPVERPAKAALLEGAYKQLEVFVGQKAAVRQIRQTVEQAAARLTEHARGHLADFVEIRALEQLAALVERTQAAAHVAL